MGWCMFEAVLLKNNDCLLYPNYSLFTLQEVQKTGNDATLLRLVCHFFQTCMLNGSWRLRQHSSVLLAWGAEYLTTRDSQSLPLSKAQFPEDYRSDSLDCLRRSKLFSGYWSQALITEEWLANLDIHEQRQVHHYHFNWIKQFIFSAA